MPGSHARFSPSAANRRIHCPPSLLLEEQFEEGESIYAAEGTAGHSLAEHLIRKYLKLHQKHELFISIAYVIAALAFLVSWIIQLTKM